jgi:hypothetical protein
MCCGVVRSAYSIDVDTSPQSRTLSHNEHAFLSFPLKLLFQPMSSRHSTEEELIEEQKEEILTLSAARTPECPRLFTFEEIEEWR